MAKLIKCNNINCFANICRSTCECLSDTPSDPCPFFKTEDEVADGRARAHKHLIEADREDLIRKYEYNSERKW